MGKGGEVAEKDTEHVKKFVAAFLENIRFRKSRSMFLARMRTNLKEQGEPAHAPDVSYQKIVIIRLLKGSESGDEFAITKDAANDAYRFALKIEHLGDTEDRRRFLLAFIEFLNENKDKFVELRNAVFKTEKQFASG